MCVLYDVHLSNLLLMACKEGTAKLRVNIRLAVTRERLIITIVATLHHAQNKIRHDTTHVRSIFRVIMSLI